ncbi:MAG: S8 family peptidase [Chloroflexi bacterium]|nr:S8 family peptidase [Chloroflexota bacterium]PWB43378.1 MAG: hypothetical protein C3F10_11880 [Dehalococcoidia bacterium]
MADEFLPIKIIAPEQGTHIRDTAGGGRKQFGTVDLSVRQRLAADVTRLSAAVRAEASARPGAVVVAKARLKKEAIAKSHRPSRLLNPDTCPILGVSALNELLIQVDVAGLGRLREHIVSGTSRESLANISTLEAILPFTNEDRFGTDIPEEIESIEDRIRADGLAKFQLFDYIDNHVNEQMTADFSRFVTAQDAEIAQVVRYARDLTIFVIRTRTPVRTLATHPSVRHAGVLPRFYSVRKSSIPVPGISGVPAAVPDPASDYPIVGVIDSGVASTCGPLQPWIIGRESYVDAAEQDNEHGSFVAGLIAFGPDLNSSGVADTGGPCRILDVTAIPNMNPAVGPVGSLLESDLVALLHEVVPKYQSEVRVWNLSLSSNEPCRADAFSDFAKALDEIQAENKVQFVLAAGNFVQIPRTWPPQEDVGAADLICAPADSVVGLTVGAVAHAEQIGSVVKVRAPSPFSRRGPGPSYLVKPDLVHYGGNCDQAFDFQSVGIRSLNAGGAVAEDIGTSMATPLVSATFANVLHALEPQPSMNLVRALMLHAAEYPAPHSSSDRDYYGFGIANSFLKVIKCTESSATVIFEDVLQPGHSLELDPFPFPACLQAHGKSVGEIKMTLVYSPPRNGAFGLEYCRANVTASLGTWGPAVNSDGELLYKGQVPPEPKRAGSATEEHLIRHGFKWSPSKSYRRSLSKGVGSTHWRLLVDLLHRAEQAPEPQGFALVVTVSGPEGAPVYNDMVAALRAYQTQDLLVRAEVRQRIQGSG